MQFRMVVAACMEGIPRLGQRGGMILRDTHHAQIAELGSVGPNMTGPKGQALPDFGVVPSSCTPPPPRRRAPILSALRRFADVFKLPPYMHVRRLPFLPLLVILPALSVTLL